MTQRGQTGQLRPSLRPLSMLWVLALTATAPAAAGTSDFTLGLEELVPPVGLLDRSTPARELRDTQFDRREEPAHLLPTHLANPPGFPGRLPSDLTALAAAPLDWRGADWRKLGVGVLAVGAVSLLDDEIDCLIGDHRSRTTARVTEIVRPLGQEGGLVLLGATWLAGRGLDRPAMVHLAEDGLEASILAAGIITPALKSLVGRSRPRHAGASDGSWRAGESFPSGEATQAFAIAAVVASHTERRWIRGVAWGLAGVVGLSRMELDAHWASDVAAGALIGSAVGRWVVRRNRPDRKSGPRMTFTPTVGEEHYGVTMHMTF